MLVLARAVLLRAAAVCFLCAAGIGLLAAHRAGAAGCAAGSEAECECNGNECDDVFHMVSSFVVSVAGLSRKRLKS